MNYYLILKDGREKVLDEKAGRDLGSVLDGNRNLDHYVNVKDLSGKSDRFQLKEIKRLYDAEEKHVYAERTKEAMDKQTKEWEAGLAKRATLSPKEKTKAEIKDRVRPAILNTKYWDDERGVYTAVAPVILKFFVENPAYPYCPFSIWRDIVFEKDSLFPPVCKVIVLHDIQVWHWVNKNDPSKVVTPEPGEMTNEKIVNLLGGGLDLGMA